jgi:phenylacetate-CoA ligase
VIFQYWDKDKETLPREDLEKHQLKALRETVGTPQDSVLQGAPAGVGITRAEDVGSLADLSRIPFTTKDDLRAAFPYGMLSIPTTDVVRMHASSGTTGVPTVIYLSRQDIARWTDYVARCIYGTGCTKSDVFQNMITYGLFTGGLGFHYGAEEVGMMSSRRGQATPPSSSSSCRISAPRSCTPPRASSCTCSPKWRRRASIPAGSS